MGTTPERPERIEISLDDLDDNAAEPGPPVVNDPAPSPAAPPAPPVYIPAAPIPSPPNTETDGGPTHLDFGPVDVLGRQALRLPPGVSNGDALSRRLGPRLGADQGSAAVTLVDCWDRLSMRTAPDEASPPPRPGHRGTPVPLPVVPATGGRSLLPELTPWWNEVDPWAPTNDSSAIGPPLSLERGGFSTMPGPLDVLAGLSSDQRSKAEDLRSENPDLYSEMFAPGLTCDFREVRFLPRHTVGSTITLTQDALIATATVMGRAKGQLHEGTAGHTFGLRMPLYSICHVEVEAIYSMTRPLIGKREKALFDTRGYGDYLDFAIEIIAADGWDYLRFRGIAAQSALSEEVATHWMTMLPSHIATARLASDWLEDHDRAALRRLVDEVQVFQPGMRKSEHRRWVSVAIPAARAISVR